MLDDFRKLVRREQTDMLNYHIFFLNEWWLPLQVHVHCAVHPLFIIRYTIFPTKYQGLIINKTIVISWGGGGGLIPLKGLSHEMDLTFDDMYG